MYTCLIELFEIELIICIKMDLALNNPQRLICHKTQTTNQAANYHHHHHHHHHHSITTTIDDDDDDGKKEDMSNAKNNNKLEDYGNDNDPFPMHTPCKKCTGAINNSSHNINIRKTLVMAKIHLLKKKGLKKRKNNDKENTVIKRTKNLAVKNEEICLLMIVKNAKGKEKKLHEKERVKMMEKK